MIYENMTQQSNCFDEQTDAALVARVLAGERDAFDLLLQRHAPSVQRLCTTLLGPTMEAQDVAQEAALQAFLGIARLREPTRFGAWLHAIASHLAHSALRRRSELSLERLGTEINEQLLWISPQPTGEEYLLEWELHEAIVRALQDLPSTHCQAVIGFYLQGYRYQELAEQLGIPLSTLKWRLFESRKLLKVRLQPLAQRRAASVRPFESPHPKETTMSNRSPRQRKTSSTNTLVALRIDSLLHFPFTRQHLAILRDPASARVLPVPLTDAEFDSLNAAFRARQGEVDAFAVAQPLAQRLLESFGADMEQVMITALAEHSFYATVTLKQGARSRKVDMRLSEALLLAARGSTPIFIERSLLETAAVHGSSFHVHPFSGSAPDEQVLAREPAVQQREDARPQRYPTTRHMPPMQPWERVWDLLLVSLLGAPDAVSAADVPALDLAAAFPTRQVTWDAQPMIAIHLPDQRAASWLLVAPSLWEQITQEWQSWRELGQEQEQPSFTVTSVPETLTPQLQQQAEHLLGQLVELPQVRTALLLNPAGKVTAWKGPETQESLQRYCDDASNELSGPLLLPALNLGLRRQKMRVILNEPFALPAHHQPPSPGTDRLFAYHGSGWRLVLFVDAQRASEWPEQMHQHIEEFWHAFLHLPSQ